MNKLLTVIGILLLPSSVVFSQDSASVIAGTIPLEMITNRPGFTEASRAVFKKGFQIETGFQYSKTPYYKGGSEYKAKLMMPNIGLLYGVSKNVELRVFTNWEGNKFVSSGYDGSYYYGIENLLVGAKINLTEAKGAVPEMALLITQGISTNINGYAQYWPTSVLLAWSYSLPAKFGISGNLGTTMEIGAIDGSHVSTEINTNYTLNLGYSITNDFGSYVEFYGYNDFGVGNSFHLNLGGGFMYRINPKFQVDLIGGYGFKTGSTLVNAGFSWLILKG